MVKGVSRRVVVVRPASPSAFEEAIFFVREQQNTTCDILREACSVAERYLRAPNKVRHYSRKRWTSVQMGFAALSGGGAVGVVWALSNMFGIT